MPLNLFNNENFPIYGSYVVMKLWMFSIELQLSSTTVKFFHLK